MFSSKNNFCPIIFVLSSENYLYLILHCFRIQEGSRSLTDMRIKDGRTNIQSCSAIIWWHLSQVSVKLFSPDCLMAFFIFLLNPYAPIIDMRWHCTLYILTLSLNVTHRSSNWTRQFHISEKSIPIDWELLLAYICLKI